MLTLTLGHSDLALAAWWEERPAYWGQVFDASTNWFKSLISQSRLKYFFVIEIFFPPVDARTPTPHEPATEMEGERNNSVANLPSASVVSDLPTRL